MMRRYAWLLCGVLGVLAAGCNDEKLDRSKYECGFPGNCCWADNTCNKGYVCYRT